MYKLFAAFIAGTFIALARIGAANADPTPAPASAHEAYSYSLSPGGTVSIGNDRGTIDVVGWAKNIVLIEADKCAPNPSDLADIKVIISPTSNTVTVDTQFSEDSGNVFSWFAHLGHAHGCSGSEVDYVVHVPHDARLALRAASADIEVTGPVGAISAHSDSGDVSIKNVTQVSASSDSGDINLAQAHGALDVSTESGAIIVNEASGDAVVHSASGDVGLYQFAGKAVVKTISGDITMRSYAGVARIDSTSGDVSMTIAHSQGLTLHASSVSGDIHSDFPLQQNAPIDIHTVSGDISVRSI